MDLMFYVQDAEGNHYDVGRMLCPVVPRIGETVYLRMSLMAKAGIDWHRNGRYALPVCQRASWH